MKCKLCEKNIDTLSLYELLFNKDVLCKKCRDSLKMKRRIYHTKDYDVEYFYDYNKPFETLLLQYKECYDEALYDAFLYKIDTYINIKYFNYHIIYAPSSIYKKQLRGFDHLRKMFESVNLKEVKGLKVKNELDQKHKTYFERQKMIDNFIYDGDNHDRVLIVDDVYTTGSTINGIYRAIKPYFKHIKVLVLAKTSISANK